MKYIELVIKIPENYYNDLMSLKLAEDENLSYEMEIIRNGTPLPKGHGDLIDRNELKTLCYEVLLDVNNPNRADGLSSANGIVEEDIDLAPTIIEAENMEAKNDNNN